MDLTAPIQKQDPNWTQVAASQRKGVLYLKMPRSKMQLLIAILQLAEEDLLQKKLQENRHSFFASGPIEDWEEDLRTLESLPEPRNLSMALLLQECIRAIKGGLRSDPEFDWISRVEGLARPGPPSAEDLGLELIG